MKMIRIKRPLERVLQGSFGVIRLAEDDDLLGL